MTKQELMENFTMEQLADMVVDLRKEHAKMLWEHCDCVSKEEFEKLKEEFDRKGRTINQIDDILENLFGVRHNVGKPNEFEEILKEKIYGNIKLEDFLPEEPIKVADVLINANYKRDKGELEKKIDKAFGNDSDTVIENVYSVSELRQIAEHLLIYCNAHESE